RAIVAAEDLYRERGAPALFQITEVSGPAGLDAALAERGYGIQEHCTTLARPAVKDGEAAAIPAGVEVSKELTADWFDTYTSVITPDRRAQARAILDRLPEPRAFLSYRRGNEVLATALCLTLGDVARVKCVATRAAARRTGAAEAVMRAAMAWATSQG